MRKHPAISEVKCLGMCQTQSIWMDSGRMFSIEFTKAFWLSVTKASTFRRIQTSSCMVLCTRADSISLTGTPVFSTRDISKPHYEQIKYTVSRKKCVALTCIIKMPPKDLLGSVPGVDIKIPQAWFFFVWFYFFQKKKKK